MPRGASEGGEGNVGGKKKNKKKLVSGQLVREAVFRTQENWSKRRGEGTLHLEADKGAQKRGAGGQKRGFRCQEREASTGNRTRNGKK